MTTKTNAAAKHRARIAELEEELEEAQAERDALKDRLTAARVVLDSDELGSEDEDSEDSEDYEDSEDDE